LTQRDVDAIESMSECLDELGLRLFVIPGEVVVGDVDSEGVAVAQ
jgi:hypothetical protein